MFAGLETRGLLTSVDLAIAEDGRALLDPSAEEQLAAGSLLHVAKRPRAGACTQFTFSGRASRTQLEQRARLACAGADARYRDIAAAVE